MRKYWNFLKSSMAIFGLQSKNFWKNPLSSTSGLDDDIYDLQPNTKGQKTVIAACHSHFDDPWPSTVRLTILKRYKKFI